MKTFLKTSLLILLLFIFICAVSWFTDKSKYGTWLVEKKQTTDTSLQWITFTWAGDSMGNRYFEKAAMFIPARSEGIPYDLDFQFDLGDSHTELSENMLNAIYTLNPALNNRVERLKNIFQFWNKNKSFKNITINAGNYAFKSSDCYVKRKYGDTSVRENISKNIPVNIGSIGADLFQQKVLIIDYPHQQFCILDSIPASYRVNMISIKQNNAGMVLLPMKLRGKSYDCLFDNGSSIFQLIGSSTRINEYANAKDNDTLPVNSWGTIHNMTGRKLQDTLEIGGQKFLDVEIYADHRASFQENSDKATPYLCTGNALFLNRTIIIDFRDKKFGLK